MSFSFGIRGARISTGSKGTYIHLGAKGIHYRQRVAGPYGQPVSARPSPKRSTPEPSVPYPTGHSIPTADASQLVDSTSEVTLNSLNSAITQPIYAPLFICGGLVVCLLLAFLHPALFLLYGLALTLAWIANQWDVERRTYCLDYSLDETATRKYQALKALLDELRKSQRLWRIEMIDHTYDWKRNAGASHLLQRRNARIAQENALYLKTSVVPLCLDINQQKLYFLPDRLYIFQQGRFGAVEYADLMIEVDSTRFIESEGVPGDADIVDKTWQYVNKNGSPDRRFNNNRELPVARYGVVNLHSSQGLNVVLHISSIKQTEHFFRAWQNWKGSAQPFHPSPQQRTRPQAPPPPRPRFSTPPTLHPCYATLGLTPTCTRGEAETKYREQALAYHPDRVNHLAPEFRLLAHQKMTQINLAYEEIKRLQNW